MPPDPGPDVPAAVDYTADLGLAHELADLADAVTLARFRAADLVVAAKPDRTPVSDADRAVEVAARAHLAQHRPQDAVLGEEDGMSGRPDASRVWVLDPIDGTKNYVRGVPVWATLAALLDSGRPVVGVVSAPALSRRWSAARGLGARLRDLTGERTLAVSGVRQIADASFSFSSLTGWEDTGRLAGFLDLTRSVWRTRAYGDFWSHLLVAEGAVDVSAEPEVSVWDVAAVQVVVEEAGGRFTDLHGHASPDGGSVVCSNGLLHDAVLTALRPR